jgi:alpha-1,6-mannosyltransferase
MPYDPSYHLLYRVDKVRAYVAAEHPDVLEIHSPYVAAVAALSCPSNTFGVRTFVWHSDFIDTYSAVLLKRLPSALTDVLTAPLWAWVRRIAEGCGATFVAARFQKEKLDAHGVPRVVHLPFGVEKEVFSPARRDARAWRAELGLPEDAKVVLAIGRFAVEKRWDVVIDAFIEGATESAHLVVFGDGPEAVRMRARAAGNPRIRFMGFEKNRERLAMAMASSDVLLHGCPYETFGLGVAEALATGLSAVLPDQGGAGEWAHLGSVRSYPSLDVGACARALRGLLQEDAHARREQGLAAAAEIPSVADHFRKLLAHYEALLSARAVG